MFKKVYSFSTKKEDDFKIVQQLKMHASRSGKSFSWLVIQALKDYMEKLDANK